MVSGYDDQGNALLAIGSSAEETEAKLRTLLETQQAVAKQTLIDNMDSVAEGIYYEVENAYEGIGRPLPLSVAVKKSSAAVRRVKNSGHPCPSTGRLPKTSVKK